MAMEKRGVIDENTPGAEGLTGEPGTKEAADKAESHPVNDMIDAVADRTDRNQT